GVDRSRHDCGGGVGSGDAVVVGNGFATGGDDLVGDGLRGAGVAALARPAAAEIIDDDTRPPRRQRAGVGAPEPVRGARDDGDPTVEPQLLAHCVPPRTAAAKDASSRSTSLPVGPKTSSVTPPSRAATARECTLSASPVQPLCRIAGPARA